MSLILGRGTTLQTSNSGSDYLIWDVGKWDLQKWAPSGSGALITVDGIASLTLLDKSNVTVYNGALTFVSATMVMTYSITSTSADGQLLADFFVVVDGSFATFTDLSFSDGSGGSIASWAWTFGDGGTSTLQNPTHTYTSAAQLYTVTLIVTNTDGNTSTATLVIAVNAGNYLVWDVGKWDQSSWM